MNLTTLLLFGVFLSPIFSAVLKKDTSDVVLLVQMTRHGARAPLNPVRNDPWIQETGKGELTPVGQRQLFQLGKNVRLEYPTLFTNSLRDEEYFVRSTDYNRTISSAQSFLQGLFSKDGQYQGLSIPFKNDDLRVTPPFKKLSFDPSTISFNSSLPFRLRPVVVNTSHRRTDTFMKLDVQGCPANVETVKNGLIAISEHLSSSSNFTTYLQEIKEAFLVPDTFNSDSTILEQCFYIGDYAIMSYKNNPNSTITGHPSEPMFDFVSRCYRLGVSGMFYNLTAAKVTATPFLNDILSWFDSKKKQIESKSGKDKDMDATFPLKFGYFSGHDDTLDSFLSLAGQVNTTCAIEELYTNTTIDGCQRGPSTASQILWELVEKKEGRLSVRVSYNGKYIKVCDDTKQENGYECKLSNFETKIRNDYIYKDYWSYCGIKKVDILGFKKEDFYGRYRSKIEGLVYYSNLLIVFGVILLVVILILFGLILCICMVEKRKLEFIGRDILENVELLS